MATEWIQDNLAAGLIVDRGTAVGGGLKESVSDSGYGDWRSWLRHEWSPSTSATGVGSERSFVELFLGFWQAAAVLRAVAEPAGELFFKAEPRSRWTIDANVEYRGRGRPKLFLDDDQAE
jgi:hypothetical protein